MSFFARDAGYWNNKVKNFLHDPPDKALQIPGHERRSNLLLDALGISATLQTEDYQDADVLAAGMDRVVLPGFSTDAAKNGAVDFFADPIITHPLGSDGGLPVELPAKLLTSDKRKRVEVISSAMQRLLRDDLGSTTDGRGLSEKAGLKGDENAFAPMRFHYLHFLFKKRLAAEDIGGLGNLWLRLPADTRLPDHSIWQHNSLVSALASCRELSPENRAGIMVFALNPVQDFIGRARKLRDFWSGSLILSWLAFEGIKVIISQLGADHVLYPSLHDQPMVEDLLARLGMEELLGKSCGNRGELPQNGVASFPNKFVFLVPVGLEKELADRIAQAINNVWMELGQQTLTLVFRKIGKEKDPFIQKLFTRQMEDYWEHSWAASPLLGKSDQKLIKLLLHESSWEHAFKMLAQSEKFFPVREDGQGLFYSVTHALVQGRLAAGKMCRNNRHPPEAGIKCDMFGEYEIIHYSYDTQRDKNPRPSDDPFWQDLRRAWNTPADFKETERLCSLGLVKRLAYRVCQEIANHPLKPFFARAGNFPSTTEMALGDWYRNLCAQAREDEKLAGWLSDLEKNNGQSGTLARLGQYLHDSDEPISDTDSTPVEKNIIRKITNSYQVADHQKYFALLLMDGDRLGQLVNGKTLAATWGSVLAPELRSRLQGDFEGRYKKLWLEIQNQQRLVAPSTHAAISEALGDFSLHTVPGIIWKNSGRLIYAGGDDVCAILPVSTVLDAAREISHFYGSGFVLLDGDHQLGTKLSGQGWNPASGRLSIHPGRGEQISISAGILISHHKKPLSRALSRTHELLQMAKHTGGRNAFALELDKRGGGGRLMLSQWSAVPGASLKLPAELAGQSILEHFLAVGESLAGLEKGDMSSSLAYRLASFRPALEAIIERDPALLPLFIEQQLMRSEEDGKASEKHRQKRGTLAQRVAALIAHRPAGNTGLALESLIIAKFVGLGRRLRLGRSEQ